MAVLGRFKRAEIGEDGQTWTPIGGLTEATLNVNTGEEDVSDVDDDGYRDYEPGWTDYTVDLTFRYKDDDPGQETLRTNVFEKKVFYLRLRPRVATDAEEYVCQVFSTSGAISMPLEGADELTATLRVKGKPQRKKQSAPSGV